MKRACGRYLLPLMVGVMMSDGSRGTAAEELLVFVSAFAPGADGAIHAYRLAPAAGTLAPVGRTTGLEHPFYLAISPDHRFLYSIHARTFGGSEPEEVAAFRIRERSGTLEPLNRQTTRGTASCYLQVDATGKTLLVANYTTGNVAALALAADGSLGPVGSFFQHAGSSVDRERQEKAHAHCIVPSPDNRFAYVADLGLDQVLVYKLDASAARLEPGRPAFVRTAPGTGPRHLTFHPSGRWLYVINELANSVTLFDYEPATGALLERQTLSTLPAGFAGKSQCADVRITPDGRFLYGTNRGHDSIAAYRIGADGGLGLIDIVPSLGAGPQNLAITPGGELLLCANMPGNNVAVFRIDSGTGRLTPSGPTVSLPEPSCILVLP